MPCRHGWRASGLRKQWRVRLTPQSSPHSRRSWRAQARTTELAIGTTSRSKRSALISLLLAPLRLRCRPETARPPFESARRASRRYGERGPLPLTERSKGLARSLDWTFLGEEAQVLLPRDLSRGWQAGYQVLFGSARPSPKAVGHKWQVGSIGNRSMRCR